MKQRRKQLAGENTQGIRERNRQEVRSMTQTLRKVISKTNCEVKTQTQRDQRQGSTGKSKIFKLQQEPKYYRNSVVLIE